MSYEKVFLKGGASIKEFGWGKVIKVSFNLEDTIQKAKSGELKVSELGNLQFDIIEKRPEKQKPNESTHYLVQSQKIEDDGVDNTAPANTNDDLPF